MSKYFVITGHLWLEHVLIRCLHPVLPVPEAIFGRRSPGFHFLVSLCEAHAIVGADLANALRTINEVRNKCAHHAVYEPSDDELDRLAGFVSLEITDSIDNSLAGTMEAVANVLERRAFEVGATDIEVIVPPPDPLVDKWLDR